jgi:hypothetical protein
MLLSLTRSATSSYRHLAIVFFFMTLVLTIVRGIYHDIYGDEYLFYLAPSVAPFGLLFLVFLIRLVVNLGARKEIIWFILACMVSAIIFRGTTILLIEDPTVKIYMGLLSSCLLLTMQVTSAYFMCINLFLEANPIKEKLWASVCVYFMLAASFGTIYSLIGIVNPGAFGVELSTPMEVYILGLVYSFNVISGIDAVYASASETIRMTAVLESIFSTLFMVILIGRLLGSKE